MDHREREDLNHRLLVGTAAAAVLFVLSGLAMLPYSFRPPRRCPGQTKGRTDI